MERVFEANKIVRLTVAPSFRQTFAVYRTAGGFRVYVEGRAVRRYSVSQTGRYTAEGVRKIAAHYGFTIPASIQL